MDIATITERVLRAIDANPEYFRKCCEMRSTRSGSTYPFKVDTLMAAIRNLMWDSYNHPEIAEGAAGFVARHFGGHLGVVSIDQLDDNMLVRLDDAKETGWVEGVCLNWNQPKPKVDFTTLLVGPNDKGEEVLWTFFPGPPVAPSRVLAESRVGKVVSPGEARQLGLQNIKLL